jgi:methyl acetate hydrolase
MSHALKTALDAVLANAVDSAGGAPGVVAMVTDRTDNLYEAAYGLRALGSAQPMTLDSVMLMASCTKAITGVAVMQLVEEGALSLDDEAQRYLPEIAQCQVLTGFDAAGQPQLRPPTRQITLRHLMLHTAGFGYEFFSADEQRYRAVAGLPSSLACNFAAINSVLLHDPGERWTYGPSIDWLGLIVEKLRGKPLGAVLQERVFDPLAIHDMAFELTPAMRARLATIHQRAPDGQLTPVPALGLPQPPTMHMGGAGLYGSTGEYLKFIRMILNDGAGPQGQVLRPETVAAMCQNGLGTLHSGAWQTASPPLANSGDFFPGLKKSWAYTFQVNDEETPTGRPAGALSWAGLANTYYWIDRKNGVGGMWCSQILPFLDIASYPGYVDFETTVYRFKRMAGV